jgi:hypothetical protein
VGRATLDGLPGLGALWDRAWRDGAGTRRTAEFLSWRYARHPRFSYDTFAAWSTNGELAGVAIYRQEPVRDLPVTVARLVEFVVDGEAAPALLHAVVESAGGAGAAMIDFFCATRRFEGAFEAEGFVLESPADPGRLPLVFQPVDHNRSGIRFMGYLAKLGAGAAACDWYVTKGDGDQDRPN